MCLTYIFSRYLNRAMIMGVISDDSFVTALVLKRSQVVEGGDKPKDDSVAIY